MKAQEVQKIAARYLPTIGVSGGPMLNGYYKGERVGSGTHLWKFSEAVKAGEMTAEEFVAGLDPLEDPPPAEPDTAGVFEKLKDVGRKVFGLKYEE